MIHPCPFCGEAGTARAVADAPGTETWTCPRCLHTMQIRVLAEEPALTPSAGSRPPQPAGPGDAECFHHPGVRAWDACRFCGRNVCGTCAFELDGEVSCGACLHLRLGQSGDDRLESYRILYDAIAMAVAVLPLVLLAPLSLITAPLALVMTVRWYRRPLGMFNRFRARYVVAVLAAGAQVVAWIAFFLYGNRVL